MRNGISRVYWRPKPCNGERTHCGTFIDVPTPRAVALASKLACQGFQVTIDGKPAKD